jgi:integrase
VNLIGKTIAGLQLLSGKTDHIEWDDGLPGFGYRLRAGSGGKVLRSWVVQYRRAGRTRRLLLGSAQVLTPDKAREAAKKALAAVALGYDPQAERMERRDKDRHSFSSVVAEHLKAKKPDVRRCTHVELTRYLTGSYFKPLHSMPVDTIGKKDIAARLVAISRESSSITAARARNAISGFFVWAMQMGMAESNPVIGAIKPKDSEGRSRVLSDAELAAVWRACKYNQHGKIVRLLILTGCRRQEIGGLRWSELDRDAGTWTLPPGRSKNKQAHTLPLPTAAWDIINSVPRVAGRDQLFGSRTEHGFASWATAKRELDKTLGDAVAPFVLHDIRRTAATKLADLGVQPHVIEQILNHRGGHKSGPAGIYNRSSYEREVKAALAMWADHVCTLADGGERVVHILPANRVDVPRAAF